MRSSSGIPNRRDRLIAAIAIGAGAAAYNLRLGILMPKFGTDFDPIRFAARLLTHGENPYATLGPGLEHFWNFRLLYPLPAVLIGAPFLALPILAARAVFVGLGSVALAYTITRRAWWPLIACTSASFWTAAALAQWSPWLVAAAGAPTLGFILAAKPNIGLAILAYAHSRRSISLIVVSMAAITMLSFYIMPSWGTAWASAIRGAAHVQPLISLTGGPILLLAGVRWRRPEARLLLALALLPQNPAVYDGLLLFLIPRSPLEALILATSSWFVEIIVAAGGPYTSFAASAAATGYGMLACLYVPAIAMLLRRPNEGPLPVPLERVLSRAPKWLRGAPSPA